MQALIEFKELVDKLQATNGRIEKENILKKYANEDIKDILHFIFNPYIVTGVSKSKISKFKNDTTIESSPKDIKAIMDYFKINNTGRDIDLKWLEAAINSYNNEYKDLIYKIVSKDIKLGIQSTTLNKIYGNDFIPQFNVMLAQKYFDNPEKLLPDGTEFILTTKLDGVRCICINEKNNPKFFSRQGQIFENLVELEEEAKNLPYGYVYDGELLLNKQGLESKDLYRETVRVTSSDKEKRNVIFNCFDMLSINEFQNGYSSTPSSERKEFISNLISDNFKFIKEVKVLYKGTDREQITYWLDKITSEGGEGVMINIADAPYECKRTKNLLKVKKFNDIDLQILDIKPGTGKYSNTLGYIVCKYKDNTVSVGSGFTDSERDYIFNHRDEYIDKVATIKYFEETSNQQGSLSLRFPIWKGLRFDKDAD